MSRPSAAAARASAWGAPPRWRRWSGPAARYRARGLLRPPRPRGTAPLHEQAALHAMLAAIGRGGAHGFPPTRLAHRPVGRLPGPVAPAQLGACADQRGPEPIEDAPGDPPLEGPMGRAVAGKLGRELVPLDPAAQAVDDRIQRRPGVDPGTARARGRIKLSEHGSDPLPQRIGDAPDRGQCLCDAPLSRHWLPLGQPALTMILLDSPVVG